MRSFVPALTTLSGIYESLSELPLLPQETSKQFSAYASVFVTHASDLAEIANEIRERIGPHDLPGDYDYGGYGGAEVFSIDKLFSDL